MKKHITIFLLGLGIFASSYAKIIRTSKPFHLKLNSQCNEPGKDGEDEDRKIIIKTLNFGGTPIQGSSISLISGLDTLQGVTDIDGSCLFTITWNNTWASTITHLGYYPVYSFIPNDSSTVIVYSLQQE